MGYFPRLLLLFIMQLVAWIVTPILPLFAVYRVGGWNNNDYQANALRLPKWLAWFDTPDNGLFGDNNWFLSNPEVTYFNQVAWLYRNSLYGFKWTILACDIDLDRTVKGNLKINHHTKTYGNFFILQDNGAWQYKLVKPIFNYVLILNFGWLLDDVSQSKALFMFSPRIKKQK